MSTLKNDTKNVLSRFRQLRPFFLKFALVGLSGIVVNQGLLALLHLVAGIPVKWAGAVAIECAILNNFFLNYFWTWRRHGSRPFGSKFIRYHLTALISGILNYLILVSLTAFGWHPLAANLVGIAVGMLVNFLLNHYWTFMEFA